LPKPLFLRLSERRYVLVGLRAAHHGDDRDEQNFVQRIIAMTSPRVFDFFDDLQKIGGLPPNNDFAVIFLTTLGFGFLAFPFFPFSLINFSFFSIFGKREIQQISEHKKRSV